MCRRFEGKQVRISVKPRMLGGHRNVFQFIIDPELGHKNGIQHDVRSKNHYSTPFNAYRSGVILAGRIFPGAKRVCVDSEGVPVYAV